MVEELFTQALRLEAPWHVKKVQFNEAEGSIRVHVDFKRGSVFACPRCGRQAKAYDTTEKVWRHLNFMQYACYLVVRVPRIDCPDDGVLQVEVPWARPAADFTYLFESLAMMLCREMPANRVSRILGVDDNKLWRMMGHYTDAAKRLEDYGGVSRIGIDETSRRKGHDYVTLFVDLDGRRTIFVTEGKGAETVGEFKRDFTRHGGVPGNVTEASIDMSPAFIRGVQDMFPDAGITFDRFHIMKILNKAVDEVRRREALGQRAVRGLRYILLKNRENLTETQRETLNAIESMPGLNLKALRAYHIRENFQAIYEEQTKEGFERALKRWYFWATHSRMEPVKEAAYTIGRHWHGVLRWWQSRVNNGILEGLNSLVQAAKAKARGYRTFKNLRTIIYMLTGKLNYAKVGLPT